MAYIYGGGGGGGSSSYRQILQNYFGGDPAKYAAEINRKLKAQQEFTDPAAARAFMQAYPQYFQQQVDRDLHKMARKMAELDRKMAGGISRTQPLDKVAYERGKATMQATASGGGGGSGSSGSGGSGNSYRQILQNYFGGDPAKYAAEIARKLAAQEELSHPEAARAFMQAYPQYFRQQRVAQQPSYPQYRQQQTTQQPSYQQPQQPEVTLDSLRSMIGEQFQQLIDPYQQKLEELYRQPRITPDSLRNMIGEQFQQLVYPYQQKLEELYQSRPQYTPRSWDELLNQASAYANLQIEPQVSALQRALEQRRQAAAAARQSIEAAYAAVPERTSRLLEEAQRRALQSLIARGGGQSGGVEWYAAELQKPIIERYQQLEADKAAKLADIAAQLNLAETQAAEQLQELEKLRGQYAVQQAKALEELDYARAVGDWERAFGAVNKLSNLAAAFNQQATAMVATILPHVVPTVQQRAAQQQAATELFGQVLPATAYTTTPVPVRQYVTERYGAQYVDYDPATGEIILFGKRLPVSSLQAYGGYLDPIENKAYLPVSVLERLSRGDY